MKKAIILGTFLATLSFMGCDKDEDCTNSTTETACRSCCTNDGWSDATWFPIGEECTCHN